ncbi:murein L,D-transpeptidase [Nitrospirota bacterium]
MINNLPYGRRHFVTIVRLIVLPAICFVLLALSPEHISGASYPGKGSEGSLYSTIVSNRIHRKLGASSPAMLESFYRSYGYRRMWTEGLDPRTSIIDLIESIRKAKDHGLKVQDYNLRLLEDKLSELVLNKWRGHPGPASLANEVELLATDSFLSYGSDMLLGRARPESLVEDIQSNGISGELMALLYDTISSGDISNSVEGLAPSDNEYSKLQGALELYRLIKSRGGWPKVSGPLKQGKRSWKVRNLRARLRATGDLGPDESLNSKLFDKELKKAVIRFQKRHGLPATGYVGKQTTGAMNISVDERIEIVRINMERLRWMPVYSASKLIIVNLTDFSLRLLKNGRTELEMKVIIGKDYNNTPDFTTKVTAIVLNPSWNVPRSITVDELLPRFQRDPGIINSIGMSFYRSASYRGKPVDHTTINWDRYNSSNFPFWLKRRPGNGSPLGKIKFIMPNKHSIYLHDTPSGRLFKKNERALSHGCVRLERPVELAARLLDDTGWDRKKLLKYIGKSKEKAIVLKDSVMVQMVYRTSWVDDMGRVHFRKDVYGYDNTLSDQMRTGSARTLELLASN